MQPFLCTARCVCLCALTFAACVALTACDVAKNTDAVMIEQQILATPGAEDLWRSVKVDYPDDFAALIVQLQALDLSERSDEKRVETLTSAWFQNFLERITVDAVKAPSRPLLAWSEREADMYATLQRDAQDACASLTMGEWIAIDDANSDATAAITQRNIAIVKAASAGRDDPQVYQEPDDVVFNQLGELIAESGISPDVQATLGSIDAMQALSSTDQCALGVAVYQGIADLPDDVEPAMAAFMLSPE